MNYYNEIDPKAAAWLRELINRDLIAQGEVDERSIEDVVPSDLKGFTQCHFFAGIGGWSYALRLAGWPDDKPVWTGSCPCQPFSTAGKGAGFADERHLWPAWFHLIKQCGPPVIFGEQVASKAVDTWIDLVHADLEGMGYAFGSVPFSSAGVGAPHIRDRNYWMAHASGEGHSEQWREWDEPQGLAAPDMAGGVAYPNSRQRDGLAIVRGDERDGTDAGRPEAIGGASACGDTERLGDAAVESRERNPGSVFGEEAQEHGSRLGVDGCLPFGLEHAGSGMGERPGPTNGFWRDADWLRCTDGKWRPVEPGTFPLAHGVPARVVRLRGYGNAINPYAAKAFIEAFGAP